MSSNAIQPDISESVKIVETTQAVVSAPATSVLPAHLDRVDGLRGTAALLIVIYHFFNGCYQPELRFLHHINLLRPLHDGWCGVNLFLVLSGFCLFWPYARDPKRELRFITFMKRRSWRVLPAYYASLIFTPAVYFFLVLWMPGQKFFVQHPSSIMDVVLHATLFQALSPLYINTWNGVTWSLSLEWMWYLAFPAAVLLFRQIGAQTALLIIGTMTVLYRVGLYIALGAAKNYGEAGTNYTLTLRTLLPGRLFEFGLGMYIAWWLVNRTVSRRTTILAIIAVPVLLGVAHATTPVDVFLPVRDMLYGTAFSLILLAVVSPYHNWVQTVLAGKQMRHIGYYSYSLYLFHLPFVSAICGFLALCGFHGAKQFALSLLFLPAILGACKLIFMVVERPFLNLRTKPTLQNMRSEGKPANAV